MGAVLSVLVDRAALEALEASVHRPEAGRSAYWEHGVTTFDVAADGTTTGSSVLGMVSRKTGPLHTAAHWLLQAPYRRMAADFPAYRDCERLGRVIAGRQGRQFTYDILRQALSLALIRAHVSLEGPGCNLVIGDGYGVMAALLALAAPHRPVITVNLTKPLLLDLVSLRRAVPDLQVALVEDAADMKEALSRPGGVIAVRADDAAIVKNAPVALAVNIVSMQEMAPETIAGYFDALRANPAPETAFYCCNKVEKRLEDGTVTRFEDYPWRAADRVLADEICPWSMVIYSRRPPFWHRRTNPIRHRLAVLDKDPAVG